MTRCSCKVFDNITHRQRKCKNTASTSLGYNMCSLHTKIVFGKCAIVIQKIFRGNRARNKLNIYKNLPFDLWDRVLFWSRYNINVKKYSKSCYKIYNKKYNDELIRLRNNDMYCYYCFGAPFPAGNCRTCKASINYKGDYYLQRIRQISECR